MKKDRIIEVATKLFSEQGYEKTSINDICNKANVSKGLIYHHFKSKEFIITEIYSSATKEMLAMNKEPNSNIEPSLQLVNLIDAIFTQLENDKLFFQLNLNLMFQPSTRKLLNKQIKERADFLFDSVKKIFDRISISNSTILSFVFISEIDGVALNYLSVFEDYPLDEVKKHLINKYKELKND